ncbi:MAG: hypothetical protein Unbinned7015contig1001_28 [Prokaryotic dsDNA virus sp.]|nr:MAG: hypothetical protein Unbinned7015contig1001_28 [Prokaryotic dsDNA virus sp.]
MTTRTTDRDCWAAIIRLAHALNKVTPDASQHLGVALPTRQRWSPKLKELAAALDVPVRRWGEPGQDDGPRIGLDYPPGPGVRPYICSAGCTGHDNIPWWRTYSSVPRAMFVEILDNLEGLAYSLHLQAERGAK